MSGRGGVGLIFLTTFCNARCAFCCVLDKLNRPELNPSDAELEANIRRVRADGCTTLSFTGGEPTVHPKFAEYCALGKELGFERITVNTNGIKLKNAAFARACVAAGLNDIGFSIHGHEAALHDELVARPGAFAAIVEAVRHLEGLQREFKFHMNATVVVTTSNAPALPQLIDTLADMGLKDVRFKHCFEGGKGADASLVALYEAAVGPVRRAAERAHARGVELQLTHFPLCLLGPEMVWATDLAERRVLAFGTQGDVFDGRAVDHRRAGSSGCSKRVLSACCSRLDERYPSLEVERWLAPLTTPEGARATLADGLARYALYTRPAAWAVNQLLQQLGQAPIAAPPRSR